MLALYKQSNPDASGTRASRLNDILVVQNTGPWPTLRVLLLPSLQFGLPEGDVCVSEAVYAMAGHALVWAGNHNTTDLTMPYNVNAC